jgi:ribosomal protein S18 acetylase RimI-like enzyme
MTQLTLEPARQKDAPAIGELSRRYVETGLHPAWTPPRVLRAIRDSDTTVLCARLGRELVGAAIMQYGDDSAHLALLVVSPGQRRRGIGRGLLGWLEDSAVVAGAFVIRLELRAGNHGAARFYESLGYRSSGGVSGYYDGVEDAVRMQRELAGSGTVLP